MRRRAPVALAALVLLTGAAGSGCAKAKTGSGAGQKVSVCDAFHLYDALKEPSPEDPVAVRRYAQTVVRIYQRVDPHIHVQGSDPPKQIVADAKQIISSMRACDHAYGQATTATERLAAEVSLTADAKLDRAINALTAYTKDQCVKKNNVQQFNGVPTTSTPSTTATTAP